MRKSKWLSFFQSSWFVNCWTVNVKLTYAERSWPRLSPIRRKYLRISGLDVASITWSAQSRRRFLFFLVATMTSPFCVQVLGICCSFSSCTKLERKTIYGKFSYDDARPSICKHLQVFFCHRFLYKEVKQLFRIYPVSVENRSMSIERLWVSSQSKSHREADDDTPLHYMSFLTFRCSLKTGKGRFALFGQGGDSMFLGGKIRLMPNVHVQSVLESGNCGNI